MLKIWSSIKAGLCNCAFIWIVLSLHIESSSSMLICSLNLSNSHSNFQNPDNIWQYSAVSVNIWQYLPRYDIIWQNMSISAQILGICSSPLSPNDCATWVQCCLLPGYLVIHANHRGREEGRGSNLLRPPHISLKHLDDCQPESTRDSNW